MAKELSRVKNGGKVLFGVAGFDMLEADYDLYTPEIQRQLGIHGVSQKVGDSAAGKRGQLAYDAIKKTTENLSAGVWTEKAESQPRIRVDATTIEQLVHGLKPEQAAKIKKNLAELLEKQNAAKVKVSEPVVASEFVQ